jgi:hypothetical protein
LGLQHDFRGHTQRHDENSLAELHKTPDRAKRVKALRGPFSEQSGFFEQQPKDRRAHSQWQENIQPRPLPKRLTPAHLGSSK